MKLSNIEVLVTKVEVKEKKESKEKYLMLSLLDLGAGDVFDIIEKDISYLSTIKAMQKYKIDLNLSSSKYGLRLELIEIKEDIGAI